MKIFSFQFLIHEDEPGEEVFWYPSGTSEVPEGAVLSGSTGGGGPLYVAKIYASYDWEAGHYDPRKSCAEYNGGCGYRWEILVVRYGMF